MPKYDPEQTLNLLAGPIKRAGKALGDIAEAVGGGISRIDTFVEQRMTPPAGQKPQKKAPSARKATRPAKPAPAQKPARSATPAPAQKPAPAPKAVPNPSPKKAPAKPAPEAAQRDRLLSQMAEAIYRTYYKEDGFRFFAAKFCRYTQLVLPGETDTTAMWIGAYNSCIEPIRYQLEKLRKQLDTLTAQWSGEPLTPANQALMDAMISFADRAEADGLSRPEGWDPEDYSAALLRYGTDLMQLLKTCPVPEN